MPIVCYFKHEGLMNYQCLSIISILKLTCCLVYLISNDILTKAAVSQVEVGGACRDFRGVIIDNQVCFTQLKKKDYGKPSPHSVAYR